MSEMSADEKAHREYLEYLEQKCQQESKGVVVEKWVVVYPPHGNMEQFATEHLARKRQRSQDIEGSLVVRILMPDDTDES